MDVHKPVSSQAVSPLTIAVDEEGVNDESNAAVANVCSSSIPNTSTSGDTVKKPRTKWRKPEDKPHHPRTGYNFFFQLERERMLLGIDHLPILPQDVINLQVGGSRVANTKSSSSYQDGSDQTIHPRALTGEKLGFADLARNVASKWKKLDSEIKKLFEEKADRERIRYRNELEEWNAQQKNKKLQEELPNPSSRPMLDSVHATPNGFLPLSATKLSQGYYSMNPETGLMSPSQSSIDQQRSTYSPMKHEINQRDFREFHQDMQDQITLRKIVLDNAASRNGKSWQHSPQRPQNEAFGEKLMWQLAQAKVISPPESTVRATSLNFYPEDSRGPLSINGVSSHSNDLSSKINRFIQEVCTVSEDLHHLAKRGSLDQRLSPPLREIERQVEFCITEFRRLSSQVQDFVRHSQDEAFHEQNASQRSQVRQGNNIPNETLRSQYQNGFDIPSLLKDVMDVRNTLDCSDYQLDDILDMRTRALDHEAAAASFFSDNRKAFRINSDSVIVQPSPRRVSNMNEPNQFARNMNENSYCTNESSSVYETGNGFRSGANNGTARNERLVQGGTLSNEQNVSNGVQNQGSSSDRLRNTEEQGNFSTPQKSGTTLDVNHQDVIQRRQRQLVQRGKNGSHDSRHFSDDVVLDSSIDFCDDDTACDVGNMECDNAFDMEAIFPLYQAM